MSFDLVAPVYDWLARLVFGYQLERAQSVWLDAAEPAGATVLIVGGGTGFLLDALLADPTRRPARIVYLEASARMLQQASRRLTHPDRNARPLIGQVTFRLGDETTLWWGEQFDIVLLPFVLDLYPEAYLREQFIPRLQAVTYPGGQWLVADFVETPSWRHRLLRWTMFRFFRGLSGIPARQLPDWPQLLTDAGMRVVIQNQSGMVRSVQLQFPE